MRSTSTTPRTHLHVRNTLNSPRPPPPVTLAFTIFVVVLVGNYLPAYVRLNLLDFCDIALITTLIGMWGKKPRLRDNVLPGSGSAGASPHGWPLRDAGQPKMHREDALEQIHNSSSVRTDRNVCATLRWGRHSCLPFF